MNPQRNQIAHRIGCRERHAESSTPVSIPAVTILERTFAVIRVSIACLAGISCILHFPEKALGQQTQSSETGATGDEQVKLDPFTVSETASKGYITTATTTATRINTPIVELPSTVTIINRQMLDDTADVSIRDAALYVSGVTPAYEHSNLMNVRGAHVLNPLVNSFDYWTALPFDPALVEDIEVIKGPNSILAPQGLAGGTVNVDLKEPLGTPISFIRPIIGNYVRRVEFDSTGPVPGDDKLSYRFVGAIDESHGYREYNNTKSIDVMPSITYQMSRDTSVTVLFLDYYNQRLTDAGLPIVDGVIPARIPRWFSTSDSNFTTTENFSMYQIFLRTHLNDHWSMQISGCGNQTRQLDWEVQNQTFDVVTGNVTRGGEQIKYLSDILEEKIDILGVHKWSWAESRFQAGFNIDRNYFAADYANNESFGGPVNVYTLTRPDPSTYVLGQPYTPAERLLDTLQQAFFVEQLSFLNKRLIVSYGLEGTATETNVEALPPFGAAGNVGSETTDHAYTHQYGVVLKVLPDVSVYYGFSQNFAGQQGIQQDGSPLPDSFGQQDEYGVKAYIYKQQIFATCSVFNIQQTNQFINNPQGLPFQVPVGDISIKGYEADLNAYFDNGLSFIATISHLKAPLSSGLRQRTTPNNAYSIWTKYAFQMDPLKGFFVGVSTTFRGQEFADVSNTANGSLPAVTLYNAIVGWQHRNWGIVVDIHNLANVDYIKTGVNLIRSQPGDPRNAECSITYKF